MTWQSCDLPWLCHFDAFSAPPRLIIVELERVSGVRRKGYDQSGLTPKPAHRGVSLIFRRKGNSAWFWFSKETGWQSVDGRDRKGNNGAPCW